MDGGYGLISCIPIVVLLVSVLWTRRIFECITVSVLIALLIGEGPAGFLWAFIDLIYIMLADETYSWILLMLLLFGGLIKLLEESGGTFGFGAVATRYIKSDKSSLFASFILGIIIFIDDYLNNLTIGSAMRGITDRYGVPREMLAVTINTTGAPVCVLNPFSTWAVFIFGLMQAAGVTGDQSLIEGYTKLIPYIFYAIIAIAMVPLLIYGIIPKFGPLKKAYIRASQGHLLPTDLAANSQEFDEERERILSTVEPKLRNFLIPMLVVVAVTILTEDLVPGVIVGIATCFIMYIPTRNMSVTKFFDSFFAGIKDMVFIATFILMAFIFVETVNGLGFSDFVIESVKPYMIGGTIPVITFIVIGVMSFAGMDFWAVMILFFPIVVPLSQHFDVNLYLSMGAIVSGAVFGGHACFFSDQMLMSSASVQIRPTDEAICLLPYALIAAGATAVLYLILGFVM
ncbi:Na+/H+ antiporter NhaC family protein [Bacillota bacterium]